MSIFLNRRMSWIECSVNNHVMNAIMRKLNSFAGGQSGGLESFSGKGLAALIAIGLFSSVSLLAQLPGVVISPAAYNAAIGGSVEFRSYATGTGVTYQWRKDGLSLAGGTNPNLVVANIARANAGQYDVVFRNAAGFVTSAKATLAVYAPPSITTQPASANILVGTDQTFTVVAAGDDVLSYQWSFNGADIAGGTNNTLKLTATTINDDGNYKVRVRNLVADTFSAVAVLKTFILPTIATAPVNQTNAAGQSVTFTVVAGGTGPFTYQWLLNGGKVGGATSASFTISSLIPALDNATVAVIVGNAVGSVTSAPVVVRVTAPVAPTVTVALTGGFALGSATVSA